MRFVGGGDLASQFRAAGLEDAVHPFVLLGSGVRLWREGAGPAAPRLA